MAIADLKASLSLEFGEYKANLKSAQTAMNDVAKTTKQTMETVSSESKKTQGVFSNFSGVTKTVFDGIGNGASKAKDAFGIAFNKMADDGDRFKNQQSSLVGTLAKTATAFVGIKSAADLFNSAIARVDKIQSAEKAIESLTGSNKDAKIVMEGLQEVVNGTPLSLDSFTASAKGMIAAGMEADKVEPIMRAIGDAAYGVGEGAPSIDFMSAAFKSLQASGTATLGDLNRLMDQNIPVYKILGNQMNMSTGDMKKFISDGLLPSGEAMDMLAKGIEEGTNGINGSTSKMAGQMQTAGTTIAGAAGNIKTAFVKSLAVPITESYDKIVNGMIAVKDGIKAVQPQMETIFSAIAAIIEGVILGIVDSFNMIKSVISDVINVIKNVAEAFGISEMSGKDLTEMARDLTPIILGLFAAFKGYVVLSKTVHSITAVSNAVKGVEGALKLLGPAGKLAVSAIKGLKVAMSLIVGHPIIAAIAAVIAAIVYFWKTNEDFRNAVTSIWEKIVSVFNACGQSIKQFIDATVGFFKDMWESIKSTWDTVASYISDISNKIWTVVKDAWDKVTSVISSVVEKIKQVVQVGFMLVVEIVKGIMLVIKSVIQVIWNGIVAYYKFIFETIKAVFTFAWEVISRVVSVAMEYVKEFISNIWNSIVEFFTPIFETIKEIFTTAWEAIKEIVMSVLTPLKDGIVAAWEAIKEVTSIIWSVIVDLIKQWWEGLVFVATTVWNAITETVSAAWTAVRDTTIAVWTVIKDWLVSVWQTVSNKVTEVWNIIKNYISAAWQAIKQVTQDVWNTVTGFLTGVWNSIKDTASSVWNAIKSQISEIWNAIKGVISSVSEAIKSVVSTAWNSIKDTTSTVWNNIKEAMIKPVEAAKEVISGIIDAIKGFFSGIRLKLPSIEMPPLPHFSLSGEFSLKPPSVPSLSVDWYATGGIATGPTIAGIGEAGDEAIVPLSNKGRMKPFAKAVSSMIGSDGKSDSDSSGDVIINVETLVVREKADVKRIGQELHDKAYRSRRARGQID